MARRTRSRSYDEPEAPLEGESTGSAQATGRFDPTSQEAILAKRKRDDDRLRDAVTAREQQLAQAADPGGDTENVLVVKQTERAAKAEQERIDAGKRAAERQQPQPPAPPPPTEGWLPEDTNPINPARPHVAPMPAGPMGEKVLYETNDILADGTPVIRGEPQPFCEGSPWIDGESDRDYRDVDPHWQPPHVDQAGERDEHGNLIPEVQQYSEEANRLAEIQHQRPFVYVPNEFTLDPKSGKGEV